MSSRSNAPVSSAVSITSSAVPSVPSTASAPTTCGSPNSCVDFPTRVSPRSSLPTDPNLEGEATATYLARMLADFGITVSRLASGLPVGGDLEFADEVTLGRAFAGRRSVT